MTEPTPLKIMSYNAGLLRLRVFGKEVFSNPPLAQDRLPHVISAINALAPDIAALQEVYEPKHFAALKAGLADLMPHSVRHDTGGWIRFHNGLCFFSKYPIVSSKLHKHKHSSDVEKYMGTKSMLEVTVELPDGTQAMFINVHTTAGGRVDPESPDSDGIRQSEIDEMLALCKTSSAAGVPGVIIGDLNAGPEASLGNYQSIIDAGFRDIFAEAQKKGVMVEGKPMITWDPANLLNLAGPHAYCPGQRCDHLFLPTGYLTVTKVEVVCTEAIVSSKLALPSKANPKVMDPPKPVEVTPSDHYGLWFELTL
jgi:endonuclease/exonuclease/phosphatase family metal-dependent hydrolase